MNTLKRGDVITDIVVSSIAAEGKCVARLNGQVIFLTGAAPGDTVDVSLTRIKSSFLEGRVIAIRKPSPHRRDPFCTHFGLCGGCSWQHIAYDAQLQYKQQQVIDNLERLGGLVLPAVRPIIGSDQQQVYRNKLDFTFTADRWLTQEEIVNGAKVGAAGPALGYHLPGMYDRVFDVKECFLQPEPSNAIRLKAREVALREGIPFFDLRKQVGFLRTLTIRTANTGEVMIILQVTYEKMEWTEKILEELTRSFPAITSANYIINGKRNDTFHDLDIVCWKGLPNITETMTSPQGKVLKFRVGPKSFYQTNSRQAAKLYEVAWNMARLSGSEHVYDLYTGTGTIANFVAGGAAKVTGIEYVSAAIEDAKVNSAINGINNTAFFAGDMKDLLRNDFVAAHGKPEVVITDPPRAGMHEDVCRMLVAMSPQRIVYVSCNPATQARDLQILSQGYTLADLQPVDMFPQTTHVENVALLERV